MTPAPTPLSRHLLQRCVHPHTGVLPACHLLESHASDWPGVYNAAVPEEPQNPWQTISGAVGYDAQTAMTAAIAEALERHAAALVRLPVRTRASLGVSDRVLDESAFAPYSEAQRQQPGFPWPLPRSTDDLFCSVYDLADNQTVWLPQEWVGLGPRQGEARLPSTSSGLAACSDAAEGPWLGLLRATQEVLERDALTCTWLNGLGGRQIPLPESLQAQADQLGADVAAYDLTQAWNPHPVIAVAGGWPIQGRQRYAFGIACRHTRQEALDKAWLEWAQGLTFAAHMQRQHGKAPPPEPHALRRFDQHAAFYTLRPELWPRTALVRHRRLVSVPSERDTPPPLSTVSVLQQLRVQLAAAGIDLYYRELTTPDVAATGIRVMRVLAPQLSGLHADERAPFLGGRCRDVAWRYPGEVSHTAFPNPLPHPLG
ncbi:YcaO-like family protein [Leeia aquatica]|uniref:YcaO domain-containing protein n=1 Tax=Leeia aquatica TaxID=2725557 RepID=A0A847SGN8_9NEIS|nr:YcaO-like family protein [Leeia aquatica]NLR76428.1 hypothetical protein [Leeia aquatica]